MSRNIKMTVTAAVTMALLAPVIMLVDGCGAVSVGGSGVSVGMSMDAKEPKRDKEEIPERDRPLTGQQVRLNVKSFDYVWAQIIPGELYKKHLSDGTYGRRDDGETGISARVLDGQAVVTEVRDGSAAWADGVRPGWIIESLGGKNVEEGLEELADVYEGHYMKDLTLAAITQFKLSGDAGSDIEAFFEKEPGLLRKIDMVAETEMDKIPVEVHVSDYREQDGIKTSFKTVINVLGQERIFTTTSVEHNIEIPEGIFDLPEDIKALQK